MLCRDGDLFISSSQDVPSEQQETLFTVRVTEHWHELPEEVVDSPCL